MIFDDMCEFVHLSIRRYLYVDAVSEAVVASLKRACSLLRACFYAGLGGEGRSASFLSPAFRIRVYQSIVQSILLYSIESVVLHFRVLRQIFKLRSSFVQFCS